VTAGRPATALTERGILMVMQSLSQGGADRVAVHLANGFVRAGIPTRIALMRDLAESQAALRAMLDPAIQIVGAGRPLGLRLSRAGPPLGHRHLERARGVRFLRRQIEAFSPAVVLAPTDNMGLITALSRNGRTNSTGFAMKLTNALDRPGSGALKTRYRRRLFDFIFQRLDLVLALSDAERRQLAGLYPSRAAIFQTVPNPYVSDAMLGGTARRDRRRPPRLLAAGRIVPQKRFDLLLDAFARIADKEARLVILGDGPLRPSLEARAQALGIADRVEMPGYTADVLARLRDSDLFVLSSDYEGLPAVIVEALASGVPVVTTDSFLAAREMLDGTGSCAVVPIGDADALAAAIDRSLATRSPPGELRAIALPYRIEAAVAAHIDALGRLVERSHAAAA
jgi:glycosyltransferase involved in cell wall biosynthesis